MSQQDERWFAYYYSTSPKCLYCAYASDTERIKALNARLAVGGCCFTHAGVCTMASNGNWFKMGQRMSPIDFSKFRIILDDKELTTMKITTQNQAETSLYDIKLSMEFDLVDCICQPLYDFLANNYECVEDIFQGTNSVYILYPNKESALKLQNFVEGGEIDGYLSDARWVKIEERYWLSLTFQQEK